MGKMSCALCEREKPTTDHHLIPRTLHSNKWFKKNFTRKEMSGNKIPLCDNCTDKVHQTFKPKELGRNYNTLEALAAHPEIRKFVKWIRKRR